MGDPHGHISNHISRHLVFCLLVGLGGISIQILTPENSKLEPKIKDDNLHTA
jgi:hypothetical protein